MSLFNENEDPRSAAQLLADGFLKEANQTYEQIVQKAIDQFERFWRRQGEGEPNGYDIFTALGTNAQALTAVQVARVNFILSVNPAAMTPDQYSPPFPLAFNPDGSLDPPEDAAELAENFRLGIDGNSESVSVEV